MKPNAEKLKADGRAARTGSISAFCSRCHQEPARAGQRYCHGCHAAYMKELRARQLILTVPQVPCGTLREALALLKGHRGRKTISAL